MEFSFTRELNLEGWRGSEIMQISVCLKSSSRISKKGALDVIFDGFSAKRDPKGYPRVPQIHQKSSKNGVQNSLGFPLAARSLPEGVQGSKRWPKVIENRRFCDRFSLEFQWQIVLKMLIPGSCWAMLWHVLLPLVLLCSQLYCSSFWLFRGVWALMLSSLSLCSPREWSLHCSALSGPFATTGSKYK